MQLRVDYDLGTVTSLTGAPVPALGFSRQQRGPLEIQFARRGTPFEVPTGTVGFVVAVDRLGGTDLAGATDWIQIGRGSSSLYLFDLDWSTEAIEGTDEIPGRFAPVAGMEPASIACLLQIAWQPPGRNLLTSVMPVTLANCVARSPATPVVGSPTLYPLPADIFRISNRLSEIAGGKWRVKADGSIQLFNADESTFHTLSISGTAGAEQLVIGVGEA